jgi:hypothetical protein
MQQPRIVSDDEAEAAPTIPEMLSLIAEVKVAVRILSELVPNPQAVEGLSGYVRDALDTVAEGLAGMQSPP